MINFLLNFQVNKTLSVDTLLTTAARSPSLYFSKEDSAASILIHQGRDHGIPAYVKFLNLCEAHVNPDTSKIRFEDLEKVGIGKSGQKLLKDLYSYAIFSFLCNFFLCVFQQLEIIFQKCWRR